MTTKVKELEKSIESLKSKRAETFASQEGLTMEREGLTLSRVADWKRFGQIALELGAVTPTLRALDAEIARLRGQHVEAKAEAERQENSYRWGVIQAEEEQAFAAVVIAYQAAMDASETLKKIQDERRKLNGHAGGQGWPFPVKAHKALDQELSHWEATRPEACGLPKLLTMREKALRQARQQLAYCQRRLSEGPWAPEDERPKRETIESYEAQWGPRVDQQKELLERLERMGIA